MTPVTNNGTQSNVRRDVGSTEGSVLRARTQSIPGVEIVQTVLPDFRRTMGAAALWLVAMAAVVVWAPEASGQEAGPSAGRGVAVAQGYKIDPRSGRLSLGITYGLSLAGHQNTVASGESRSVDLGIIGTTLAGEGCDGGDPTLPKEDQPQPLVARSTDEDAGTAKSETENGVDKRAYADDTPLARAVATTAAAGDPAAILVGSTRSETESGIVDGVRVARAVTDVASLSLGGGAVVLRGLRWEATYQTAPVELTEASFTIEGVEVGGQELTFPEDDPLAALAEANAALNPLGFSLEPPKARVESGIAFVDPLRVAVVPSDVREGILGPVLGAIQPIRESLFDAIIEADCGNATYILVADIVLGSVTGAGSFGLELGGVSATTADINRTSFLGDLPVASPALPTSPGQPSSPLPSSSGGGALPSASPAPSAAGGPSAAPTAGAPDAAPIATSDEVALDDVEEAAGTRGGALAGVGVAGLALLSALAAADARKMRRAQRSVPMEVLA